MRPSAIVRGIFRAAREALFLGPRLDRLEQRIDQAAVNQGLILCALDRDNPSPDLRDHEFKVFSQWGEDGIIQFLTRVIEVPNRTFIEFGVGDFSESNCRYLMEKDDWKGFVLDGSGRDIRRLRGFPFFWKHQLEAVEAFLTRENIEGLLARSGFPADLGLLSIDVDGIDYHLLEAITAFTPRILVCEYNPVFGGERKITVPYDPAFRRTEKHFSNLYFGASLGAIAWLAERKGYALVGTNSTGSNAFFVRRDLVDGRLRALTVGEAYAPSLARESRDRRGALTFVGGEDRLALIRGLPVLEVEKGTIEPL